MVKISSLKRKLERLTLMTACAISFVILAAYADSVAGPWTQVATTGPPSPRSNHGLAYDSARGVTVLFGGFATGPPAPRPLADTWEWDGSLWKQVATTGPSPRFFNELAYDSTRGVTVLFGGFDLASAHPETVTC
jgi:hypothetical protein